MDRTPPNDDTVLAVMLTLLVASALGLITTLFVPHASRTTALAFLLAAELGTLLFSILAIVYGFARRHAFGVICGIAGIAGVMLAIAIGCAGVFAFRWL